jgi:hypothetical protein
VAKAGIFAIDFDGTLAEHKFPDIGNEVPGAFAVLKDLQAAGHRLILWTMRSDGREPDGSPENGPVLSDAVAWCKERGVEFWSVNGNPGQGSWTQSPKCYAHVYIDDAALGCPLRESFGVARPMVDWAEVREQLVAGGWLPLGG